jgi:hypothetical protein
MINYFGALHNTPSIAVCRVRGITIRKNCAYN